MTVSLGMCMALRQPDAAHQRLFGLEMNLKLLYQAIHTTLTLDRAGDFHEFSRHLEQKVSLAVDRLVTGRLWLSPICRHT